MKTTILISLLAIISLSSCKKEVIEKYETTIIDTVLVSSENYFVLDTFIDKPYKWLKRNNKEHWKTIKLDSIKSNSVVDVYIGVLGFEWLNLPYINQQDNIAINYFWRRGEVTIMAYGDSAILNNPTYWANFKDYIKIKVLKTP